MRGNPVFILLCFPASLAIQLVFIITNADAQANANLRDLWSNLLARELTSGSVHPEVADILAQLTVENVTRIFNLAKDDDEPFPPESGVKAHRMQCFSPMFMGFLLTFCASTLTSLLVK